jgi:hypothetical protein
MRYVLCQWDCQKAHIHVQARVATSCRHTVPLTEHINHILLYPVFILFDLKLRGCH